MIRYVKFGDNLLLFEQVNAVSAPSTATKSQTEASGSAPGKRSQITASEALEKADEDLKNLYHTLVDRLNGLGDDVEQKTLRYYFAFSRIRNFASVEIKHTLKKIVVHVNINPDDIQCEEGFTRDVRDVGHYGTGDLEITIKSYSDIERALQHFQDSYENA